MQVAISRGDSHYWTYEVSPSNPLTGSPLLDLLLVLQVSDGLVDLYITDPSGAVSNSATYASTGALYTNRSVGSSAPVNSSQVLYGVYSLQVYCVQSDVYTLSASMTQRQQLTATDGGVASAGASSALLNSVGGVVVNGSVGLVLSTFAYADWWYNNTAEPAVQLTVTLTLDDAALQAAGLSLASVQLPLLYWAQGVDVPAWSPAGAATWSTAGLTGPGQLSAVVSTFSDCSAPPCRYSFLVVAQQSLPALPLLTLTLVDLDSPYDASLDFTQSNLTPAQLLGNVSISTSLTPISANGVHYYQFPVLDGSETLLLTLLSPDPSTSLQLLLSRDNDFPDLVDSTWQLSPTAQSPSSQQLRVSVGDAYFSPAGGAQVRTMEGLYQVAVVAQSAGSYTLRLDLSDTSNSSAPLLVAGVPVSGAVGNSRVAYFRFLAPRPTVTQRYDLHFQYVNCSLFISDWWPTPGPSASAAQNDVAQVYGTYGSNEDDFPVFLGQGTEYTGVYYIGVAQNSQQGPFQLLVTYTPHVLLSSGSTYTSTQPLLAPAPLYFEYSQTGQSTQTLQLTLILDDPAEFGSLYANIASHNNPNSVTDVSSYPPLQCTALLSQPA